MTERKEGTIFNIQRFCITDGDGIRTTVFFKGCPLRCKWCHNPESQSTKPQLLFKASRCVACGSCAAACKNEVHRIVDGLHGVDFDSCKKCGECMKVCCYDALELCGHTVSAEEILEEMKPDFPYYGEKGGVTISGGEPLAQPEFLLSVLRLLKEKGINVYLETCGYAKREVLEELLPYVDCFLFDWKCSDSSLHKEYTGVDNRLIEENLRLLNSRGKRIVLRCPIIPGVNDNADHFKGIARLDRELEMIDRVELMAYHSMGEGKKEQLGREDSFRPHVPDKAEKEGWLRQLRELGCSAILG